MGVHPRGQAVRSPAGFIRCPCRAWRARRRQGSVFPVPRQVWERPKGTRFGGVGHAERPTLPWVVTVGWFWQVRMTHGTHEILMFGRNVFVGYLLDPDLTAEAIDERGWLHSSDIGQADRSAFLYVTGRRKVRACSELPNQTQAVASDAGAAPGRLRWSRIW